MPTDGRTGKQNKTSAHSELLLSLKEEGNPVTGSNGMNLEDIVLSEIRQSRKDRHGSIYTRSLLLLLLLLLRRLTRVRLCATP